MDAGTSPTHLVFDFFGTLVSYSPSRTEQGYPRSFALLARAGCRLDYPGFLSLWSQVSAELDAEAEASLREFSMLELAGRFLPRAVDAPDEQLARDFVAAYLAEWNTGVRYPPGIAELLARLAERHTLAVVTNTHEPGLVPDHLERMGVSQHFVQVVTSVEYGWRKPAPEIFAHTLGLLGAAPEGCVYVGDSYEADYRGARSAGLRPLLIDPACEASIPSSDRLGSILELERVLDRRVSEGSA